MSKANKSEMGTIYLYLYDELSAVAVTVGFATAVEDARHN